MLIPLRVVKVDVAATARLTFFLTIDQFIKMRLMRAASLST
jgi:hypothetical protein